ncbi:unnamed protein product [Cyclocybe aegerita]|uniref:Citrate transporter-like domain-containing protein n=1 Tax=Cyclocybe aegerita TaxID=1973307 RepID=A0A8S0W0A9_CYCAE|nr:unnamed protein product [Cyclocybe aegerita]
MSDIDRFSIVTLVLFFLSTIFVIQPLSFHVRLPFIGRTRLTIGLMTAPIIAIAILWAAQCIGATQIRDGIVGTDNIKPYNILILFISLAYMAITLDVTGILQAAAFWHDCGERPHYSLGHGFLVYYTAATGLEPIAWLISEFAAANTASMVLFVGNPTNVVICEGFRINNAAFTAYTILPFLACSVACYAGLAFQFRGEKHVPRRLNAMGELKPREVLRDPVSACFGSILLAVCLTVVIVLSFFHIDVWKIVLPFAVAKFIFDLSWDHYRYVTDRIPRLDAKAASEGHPGDEDAMVSELKRAMSMPTSQAPTEMTDVERRPTFASVTATSSEIAAITIPKARSPSPESSKTISQAPEPRIFAEQREKLAIVHRRLAAHFPTFFTALPRLPFGLIPFAFSQFILIEGLARQGWIDVFATWFVKASHRQMIPAVWLVGFLGVILCNISGTNIGATILLTKIVRVAELPDSSARAAAISLAVASNIGAVSFTFSASLAGLLWQSILKQKGITFRQLDFAFWNTLPLILMTAVGLAIVTAEMVVLY